MNSSTHSLYKIPDTDLIYSHLQVCHILNLRVLYLEQKDGRPITELPDNLGSLTVTELYMQHNNLRAVPPCVSEMPHLLQLYLNDNRIEILPSQLCSMMHLQVEKIIFYYNINIIIYFSGV